MKFSEDSQRIGGMLQSSSNGDEGKCNAATVHDATEGSRSSVKMSISLLGYAILRETTDPLKLCNSEDG